MKTKEKLERAGWVFEFEMDNHLIEVYSRASLRIVLLPVTDDAKVYYDLSEPKIVLHVISELQLELFCEPLIF